MYGQLWTVYYSGAGLEIPNDWPSKCKGWVFENTSGGCKNQIEAPYFPLAWKQSPAVRFYLMCPCPQSLLSWRIGKSSMNYSHRKYILCILSSQYTIFIRKYSSFWTTALWAACQVCCCWNGDDRQYAPVIHFPVWKRLFYSMQCFTCIYERKSPSDSVACW